ncbi:MAG TPA: hypothetical protein VIV40_35460 [Kofleriaceae bacterium]
MLRAWLVVLVTCVPFTAFADEEPAAKYPDGLRLMASSLSILRLNPTGLETRARVGLQKKLYPSDKPITENNFFFAGVFPKLNPASAQIGIGGELQPASIFNVRSFVEVQKYFGTVGYLQSFGSANANYSDATLANNKDNPTPATEPEAATGMRFSVQPMLQLKFGKIALRALAMFDYWNFSARGATAYEPTVDTLLPDAGWTVSTDTDLLYVTGTGLAAGLRHSWVKPMYSTKHFVDAADEAAYDGENAHQRLGLFAAYTLHDTGPSTFNKPTVILIVSWYLQHKYRAGEPDVLDPGHTADDYRSRALPYFLAGFAFESDFIDVR